MTRYLIVVPPLAGHVNPMTGVAARLEERGHEVAWAGPAEVVRSLVGPRGMVLHCAAPPELAVVERPAELRGFAAMRFLWELFLMPLAESMVPGVRAAVAEFAPDVLVVDQQAFAGALVAEESGLPWCTSATTSGELVDPLGRMPKIATWRGERMRELCDRFSAAPDTDLRFSSHLVLVFSTEELVGSVPALAGRCRFVGPSLGIRPDELDFPWHRLEPTLPTVLVTLGTANDEVGRRFLAECVRALAELSGEVQAVVADPARALGPVPAHIVVRPRVPLLDLLERANAVVCHAGHNTVCESLAHGVPLVVAPIRDDQPIVAQQVVNAGAGVRLRFTRATAAQLRNSIRGAIRDPAYRDAAGRIQRSFHAAGGITRAANLLEELAYATHKGTARTGYPHNHTC